MERGFKGVGVRNMFFSCEIAMFLSDFDYFQGKSIFWEPEWFGHVQKAFSGARVVWARGGTDRLSELRKMLFTAVLNGLASGQFCFSCDIAMLLYDLEYFQGKTFSQRKHPPPRRWTIFLSIHRPVVENVRNLQENMWINM